MGNATIIFYSRHHREVMWEEGEWESPYMELFPQMQNWLVNGHTFEILEFHPNGPVPYTAARARWWDEQLYNLGYDIAYLAADEQRRQKERETNGDIP